MDNSLVSTEPNRSWMGRVGLNFKFFLWKQKSNLIVLCIEVDQNRLEETYKHPYLWSSGIRNIVIFNLEPNIH